MKITDLKGLEGRVYPGLKSLGGAALGPEETVTGEAWDWLPFQPPVRG